VAEATGVLPLDYMLGVMRDPSAQPKRRDAMAMAAAPYLHAKMSSVEPSAVKPNPNERRMEVPAIQVTFVTPPRSGEDK
jgi:hypothetical protein